MFKYKTPGKKTRTSHNNTNKAKKNTTLRRKVKSTRRHAAQGLYGIISQQHKRDFSSIQGNNNKQPMMVFPTMKTGDNMAVASLPEYKSFDTELAAGRLVSAEQYLSRLDGIFSSFPMPSVQTEVNLKKAQLHIFQGKFTNAITALETIVNTLNTAVPFGKNPSQQSGPAPMSPILSYPQLTFKQPTADDTNAALLTTLSQTPMGYNDTPLETTYIPVLSTLTTLYIATGDVAKAQNLISTWKTKFQSTEDTTTTTPISHNGLVQMAALEGLVQQTQLVTKLREIINNNNMNDIAHKIATQGLFNSTTPTSTNTEPTPVPKPKPKFVLKTTSVKTSNDVKEDGNNETNNNNNNTTTMPSNEEILAKKQQEQVEMINAAEATADANKQNSNTNSTPTPSSSNTNNNTTAQQPKYLSPKLVQLLTLPTRHATQYNTEDIDGIVNSLDFIQELTKLPIGDETDNNTTTELVTLFKSSLKSYLNALIIANTTTSGVAADNNNDNVVKVHNTDIISHIVTLFNTIKPLFINLSIKDSQYEATIAELNKAVNVYLCNTIMGYTELPIDTTLQSFMLPNAKESDQQKIAPYHITQSGPRLITTALAHHSTNLITLNATLKHGDVLPNLAQYVDPAVNSGVNLFANIETNKGSFLSSLLSAISQEYLSLNPVNAEGLIRTAIKYVEKQPLTWHTQQQLVDLQLTNAFIVSNLSWNGKTRQREAINLALNAVKMMDAYNTPQIVATRGMVQPRYLDFDLQQIYINENQTDSTTTTQTTKKSIHDIIAELDEDADNVKNYKITFKNLPPQHEQWIFEKYAF